MPKVTEEHRASRRDQILHAALRCFAEHGFHASSMADIITASGLSAGAIYLYFNSKSDILIAAARLVISEVVLDVVAPKPGEPVLPPSQLVRRIGARLDSHGLAAPLLVQLWGEAATNPDFRDIVTDAFTTLIGGFSGYLTAWRIQEGANAAAAAQWTEGHLPIMLAICQGYIIQRALLPTHDEETYFAAVTRVLG
jgi:AcrR family transcriptional regulator